jgi:hypothetical protein
MKKTAGNQYNITRIQGDSLSFVLGQTQTPNLSCSNQVVFQSTTINYFGYEFNGVSVRGYTVNDKLFISENAILVESLVETTATGKYQEESYILPVATSNPQINLFNDSRTVLKFNDLRAVEILACYLATPNTNTSNLTIFVSFDGSEEKKIVVAGEIENTLEKYPIKNIESFNWIWKDA